MWAANVILTGVGSCCWCAWDAKGATSRGGDLSEFTEALRELAKLAAGSASSPNAVTQSLMRRLFRPLDRYVFSEFWKIFTMTRMGFPVLIVIIDLTDNLDKYLNRQLPRAQIALSYCTSFPIRCFS
jgi:hypothetical protein